MIELPQNDEQSLTVGAEAGLKPSLNLTAQASGSPAIVTLTRANGALVSYQDDGMGNFTAQTLGVLNSLNKDVGCSVSEEATQHRHINACPPSTSEPASSITGTITVSATG